MTWLDDTRISNDLIFRNLWLQLWHLVIPSIKIVCRMKWCFVTKIVLTYCEKKCSSDRQKLLKFEAAGREFPKFLRSLEYVIYSNSERSEQFMVTEYFFNLFLEVSQT